MWFKKWVLRVQNYFNQLDAPNLRESRTFLWLWSLSFYLNYAENWYQPGLTFAILGVCISTFLIPNLRWAWGLYLAFSTAILVHKFPILANHSIFNLFVNLYLIYLWIKDDLTKSDHVLARSLLLGLVVVYFWAALHKVNGDFLFFDESCAYTFMGRINRTYFAGHLPTIVTLNGLVPLMCVLLEFLIAYLLFRRKTFYLGFIFAVGFHVLLAALEFIDFSMNSLSILVVVLCVYAVSRKGALKKILDVVPYYCVLQLIAGLVSFFESKRGAGTVGYILQACLFAAFSGWVLFYGLRIATEARGIAEKKVPRSAYVLPLALLVLGSFNYLGLSTAGTFSMFSNLRTEGAAWNHLLIPRTARIFKYQDKVYWIRDIDPNFTRTNREHPRVYHGMPEIEFYRLIDTWRATGRKPKFIEYEVDGVLRRNGHIVEEKEYPGREYSWLERKIFFFRRIQRDGKPNKCRW